jgi:ribokinase
MGFDIITFGSAVVDVFVHTDTIERKNQISYPVGGKILIKELRFDIGGGGTNTAVAFARLGFKTGYIGKIGMDENGDRDLNLLKKENVKFLGKRYKDLMTGYSVILDSRGGERTILTYKGANNDITIEDTSLRKLKSKWAYFTSLMGKGFETQKKLAPILKNRGIKIAFNPSSYLIKEKNLEPILNSSEVVILNKEEAEELTKTKDSKNLLKELVKLGPSIAVVTDKDSLIRAYDGKREYRIIPHKIKVVERTGAGDAFGSGFVAGLMVGKTIPESLKLGLRESESVITHIGAKNNLIKLNLKKMIR